MGKIRFIMEDERQGKETISADEALFIFIREDPVANQPKYMFGTEGDLKDGNVLANMLAAVRNCVMEVLAVREDQEALFDKAVRKAADQIRNRENTPEKQVHISITNTGSDEGTDGS